MDENDLPRFFSEEQIMALVLIERHGVMDAASIAEIFDVSPRKLACWWQHFADWRPFHAPEIHTLRLEHDRLRRWLPRYLCSCPAYQRGCPRTYSEEQITAMIGLVTHDLASPDEVAQRFCVDVAQLFRWWASRLRRSGENLSEVLQLQRENKHLKLILQKRGIDFSGETTP